MPSLDPAATARLLRAAHLCTVVAVLAAVAAGAGRPGPRALDVVAAVLAGVAAASAYVVVRSTRRTAGGR